MTGSLAFRKNEAAIMRGIVPEKYMRLLPFITGQNVIELGSAEGVLACLLARERPNGHVIAMERKKERHDNALRLYEAWNAMFPMHGITDFVPADIRDRLDMLDGMDTLIAVRMIYYLRDDLDAVFAAVAEKVPNVLLCGNRQRAAQWRQGIPDKPGGAVNYYASHEGMRALLERHGYTITAEVIEGDPIVCGARG